jgi:hypothetical protein
MKKVIVNNWDKVEAIHRVETFVFEGPYLEVSDGYHTFDELYEHRITLFIALCRQRWARRDANHPYAGVWRSKLHADGTMYDGWFIMGIGKAKGLQISYHLPTSKWNETDFAESLDRAPEWDGHTPGDVLERLKSL